MRRVGAICGLAALAAACAPAYPTTRPVGEAPIEAPPPAASAPPPPAVRAPPLQSRPSASDQCGAAGLQRLVGRPRSEIPVPVDPNRQRVACSSCPVTQDFDPARLNFFFDADSGLIREVRCG